jgi:oligopeptidase A
LETVFNLVQRSKPQAEQELAELKAFSGIDLMPWDLAYYSEKLKQKKFGFKQSDLAPNIFAISKRNIKISSIMTLLSNFLSVMPTSDARETYAL